VQKRLLSLDALRGFDMFWIIGGDYLIHSISVVTGFTFFQLLSEQLQHVPWDGLHAYDLIFPLFMFISGVSLTFSLDKALFIGVSKVEFLKSAGWRAFVLVFLGIIYNFGWSLDAEKFRVASVLGQIGVAYFIAALVFVLTPQWYMRLLCLCAVLTMVALLQLALPVPGVGAGVFTPEGTVNGWVDRMMLPGRLYGGSYDPEGYIAVLSSSAVTMAGGLIGQLLITFDQRRGSIVLGSLLIAALLITAAFSVSSFYPIIKAIWTVPFVLVSIGFSIALLVVFYYVIDVMGYRSCAFIFAVIGMNSIGVYMGARFFVYPILQMTVVDAAWSAPYIAIPLIVGVVAIEWLVLWWCYQKKWFLKV
jgi:predicted acyltransferase